MKINNVDRNNMVLDHGVIQVEDSWIGGSQTELCVTLYIERDDKHHDCANIEDAFSKYFEITEGRNNQ